MAPPPANEHWDQETTEALFRPIVFLEPDRLVHPPSWIEHIPFAFWLVDVLRPRVFVELGTHAGNSYAAFAQAVRHLGLDAAGYAVDTWEGDPQAGFYDETVYTEWKLYHDRRYSAFSSLVRTTFDDALGHFPDGGIDLLNIDGFHSAEAVRHDFENWLPKMSTRGVVLMHDINVRERDFGAWEIWQRLRGSCRTFQFLHGHGLGVVGVGTDLPPAIEWLLGSEGGAAGRAVAARQFFARAGGHLLAQYRAEACLAPPRPAEHDRTAGGDRAWAERETAGKRVAAGATPVQTPELLDGGPGEWRGRRQLTPPETWIDQQESRLGEQPLREAEEDDRLAEQEDLLAQVAGLREQIPLLETRVTELMEELSRRDTALAALRSLSTLPAFAQSAGTRALAATAARLRALAAKYREARQPASWMARVLATLGALDILPHQLLRRPRGLARLLRFLLRPRLLKDAHQIASSGLFDAAYYARLSPDVAERRANPLAHYVMSGGAEGRSPCLLFDAAWYVSKYPEVAASGANPLAHYLRTGAREDRDPHPLFSSSYYRAQLGPERGARAVPLHHYMSDGVFEGRSPHPLFDPEYYMQSCGGAIATVDPFAHFLAEGAAAGMNPHPLFDIAYYLQQLPPAERTGHNPLQHYLYAGAERNRTPHPLFHSGYYRARNPDVVRSGVDPLIHYVTIGGQEGRQPLPEFDGRWYLASYEDVAESGANPLIHYVRHGWLEGRDPSPRFSTRGYLGRYPDVTRSGINPLVHYLEAGLREGRVCEPDPALEGPAVAAEPEPVRLRTCTPERVPSTARVVVCLTHVLPVSPRAGNEYRIHRMLTWLRRAGYIVIPIVAPADGSRHDSSVVGALAEQFGNAVVCGPDGEIQYLLRDVPDVLGSLDGELTPRFAAQLREGQEVGEHEREMLQMDRSFCSDALTTTVLRLQSGLGPYVLLAEYIWMSRVLPLVGGRALKIIDTIDVFSSRQEKVGQFGVQDLFVEPEAERKRLRRGDVVIAIQQNERQTLEALVPGMPVVTAGVDFDLVEASSAPAGREVLYVASDNPMNRHGLRDFLRFAWPRVRMSVPDAELLVVGGVGASLPIPPEGVSVLGKVDDLEPLYARCRAVINPAVAGTGVKIKTIEALAHLRRVVAWPNGVDGLNPAVAGLCRTVEDWYSFAEALTEVLTNDAAAAFSAEDRELLRREGAADTVYGELGRVLEEFFQSEPQESPSAQRDMAP